MARFERLARSPLVWILASAALLHVVGIGWGLPASDGWDNDGVAPRDCLAGLVETFTPGSFFTYPPVHIVLLGLLTLPVTITALVRAASLAPADVVHEMVKVPYMTIIAYVARTVSLAMSLGIVYAIAKIAEEVRGRRAGLCAAAVCAVNAPFTYYAHTTNLDVPYLFWSCLALLALVRAIARREPRRLRAAMALAVLAVGTKDQAYALFLLSAPAALLLWLALDLHARDQWRAIGKQVAVALGLGALLFLVTDAVVFNPTGFRARVRFLTGPASQDFAQYSADWLGRWLVVKDGVLHFPRYYPLVFALFTAGGFALYWIRTRADRAKLVAGLVPLLALLSYTITFNCVARRTDHRFLLPQYVMLAVYAGFGIEPLLFELAGKMKRIVARASVGVCFALAALTCADIDANLVLDPRYDAEAWLASHVSPGETIEVHGNNVYLPRFPAQARVVRVGPDPTDKRNPLPGVLEVDDTYENTATRKPEWLVVSQGWVWRYLTDIRSEGTTGRVPPATVIASSREADGTGFFQGLLQGQRGYVLAHASGWTSKIWPPVDIHASTAREVWIFHRVP